ncbi:MAG: UDP-N-acetylmuramoyl-tripeptide--D-alanyl-D-alanine ligase [Verrucomicrobiae bacterium]|nr:UDP-N-acetylmuramoyl-tripeptide--D-alanyl-D-alanine ligase [Verrucomicrobiae bacterium]
MEARDLQFVISACGGTLAMGAGEVVVTRVITDSRQAQAGDLFFALRGEKFDGRDFLEEVARKGAAVVVSERQWQPPTSSPCAVVVVDDTRRALGRLATEYRKGFELPVVAVAGSNGKTTTKDLIAAVLGQKLLALRSAASFNNDIGVPLTLLQLEQTHEAAVLEIGTNHPGELASLVKMSQPRMGVITNIGREHLEFFGDLAGVAEEEGRLAELLPTDGKLFLNGDNEWTGRLAERTPAGVVRVGFSEHNQWRARSARLDKQGVTFRVETPHAEYDGEYRIRLLGRHQVLNALFALALGAEFGLNRAEIERGLAECEPAKMRLQLWELNGVRVLDDAYNANADSMLAALQLLKELPCKGRRVAVLGDMAELGAHRVAAHAEAGRVAAELGVGQLFVVGEMAGVTGQAARDAGLTRVIELADVDSAAAALKTFLKASDVVLLKASRAARFERISDALRGGEAGKRI